MQPDGVEGLWSLARRLCDRRSGTQGTAHGRLTVRRGVWLEEGEVSWAGRRLSFTRQLRFVREAGEWWLSFDDGRLFHPWRPGTVVEHPCRDDLYRGIVVLSGPRIRTLWDVSGPAKDQRLITRLRR